MIALLGALLFATAAHAHPADVENISPERYFEVALNEIQQAQSSIHLYMYLISLPANRLDSKVYRLVDALVEAKDRGVNIQVVLDRNIPWAEDSNLGFWDSSRKNGKAYRYLREKGVEVFFEDEAIFTHAKALVVDRATVILGSSNWSDAALTRNVETNALIRSKAFAEGILKSFETLELYAPEVGNTDTVAVPYAFLGNKKLLGRMVSGHDEGAFDAYLYLLKAGDESGEEKLVLDYELLSKELGLKGSKKVHRKNSVQRTLRRLRDKYDLVTTSYQQGEDPTVSLKALEGDFVEVPYTYWTWGWSRELTFAGKVMYLLSTRYASESPTSPVWFRSTTDIAKDHGFWRKFVSKGTMDLRRHNLIEVQPGPLDITGDRKGIANQYAPNPLYDPKELEEAFQDLKLRYGEGKVAKARGYVGLVYEDSDIDAVERLILLEEEFGEKIVQEAVSVVSEKSSRNPKRTVGYLINTIRTMAVEGGLTTND